MNRSLEFTTKIGCYNNCHFCPQSALSAAYKSTVRSFGMAEFNQVISTVPKTVEIHFSGFTEPFFNRLAPVMIHLAKHMGYTVHLYTTLMGMDARGLRRMPHRIDFVKIHVPDQTGLKLNDENWIAQHEMFLTWEHPAQYMAMGPMTPKVEDYLSGKGISVEIPTMLSRGGNLWKSNKITGPLRCSMNRWHNNVVLPNGDVYACCMDYGLTMKVGNLLTDPYEAIQQKSNEYAANNNPPEDSICRTCEWAQAI